MAPHAKYTREMRRLISLGWDIRQKQINARKRYLGYDLQMSVLIAELQSLNVEIPPSWNKR